MAVQVVCYELYQFTAALQQNEEAVVTPSANSSRIWDRPATQQQFESLMGHLQETLLNSGFVDPDAPGHTLTRLRRLLARHQLDETEVQILRGVLKHLN